MKKGYLSGSILIVIAAALWALDGVVRRSLYTLPATVIVFMEHLVGALILAPVVWKKFSSEHLSRKEWGALCIVALFSSVLGTLWFTTALLMTNYISFSVVFLLQKLQPLFAIATAHSILKERVDRRYLSWAALALGAAYFITFPTGTVNIHTGDKTLSAAILALGAAIAWGSATAFSRFVLLGHSDSFITGLRFWIATAITGALVLIFGLQSAVLGISWQQIGLFTGIALSTGMGALLIYYKGLKTTPVKVSTILELTFPLLAMAIDVFVYKTTLLPVQLIAAAVLMFAMVRINRLQTQ